MADIEVAVIIVTYRTAALTLDALRSLAAERLGCGPRLRIRAVVVDNASGDFEAISRAVDDNGWSDWVSLLLAPRNGGFAYGNNLGVARARAEGAPAYLHLLNPDAQVRPGAIPALVQFLESNPQAGIAGGSFDNPDGSLWPISFRFPGLVSELTGGVGLGLLSRLLDRWTVAMVMPQDAPRRVDWICGASMMIRTGVFDAVGGLDENYFLYYEETDFCRRALRAGFATWYVPQSRVLHIMGQSTQVTSREALPRRLPAYWFESRRRYFAVTFGTGRAMLVDVVALGANLLGRLKNRLQRRSHAEVPHFLADLLRHSVLLPRNRRFPPPLDTASHAAGGTPSRREQAV